MRQSKTTRRSRSGGVDRRGLISDMVSITVCPPEIEDRLMPGYWQGDLIKGKTNVSSLGMLVERSQRLLDAGEDERRDGDLGHGRLRYRSQWHAAGDAPEHHLRSKLGDGAIRSDHP